MTQMAITFTENAEQEVSALAKDLHLMKLIPYLREDSPIPEELREVLLQVSAVLADLFNSSLPTMYDTPEETLRAVSRDINLSKLLRERGLARLYLLTHTRVEVEDGTVNLFQTLDNPDTGSTFKKQEQFLGWFCKEASVSRALVFQRFATYLRMVEYLGYSLEESFNIIITKPYAIRETMNAVIQEWDGAVPIEMDPDVATQLAKSYADDEAKERISEIVKTIKEADSLNLDSDELAEVKGELFEEVRPLVRKLLEEVAIHDSVHDAMEMVNDVILNRPEITYYWNSDMDCLEIEYILKQIDDRGVSTIAKIERIAMLPDSREDLPAQVKADLLRRLPVRNADHHNP